MLITERPGRLRVVRNGVLEPQAITGVPKVRTDGNGGLMDVALHPRFAENHLVYLTYTKAVATTKGAPALARARLEGGALVDLRDVIVAEPAFEGTNGLNGRVVFGRDGMVYMSTGGNTGNTSQEPGSLRGKILRLNDDGSVPRDNPFVGRPGYRPEIYTLGHRNTLGLIVHPETGEIWNNENGPNGGDEINIIRRGRNYGWPILSFGREYPGPRISDPPTREGMESPLVVWLPQIATAGMAVSPAIAFPPGSAMCSWVPCARAAFRDRSHAAHRLQRQDGGAAARAVVSGAQAAHPRMPPGTRRPALLLTDDDDGALLRIEPTS
jgi:glucose/arabinose dehydrogenase